MKKLLYILTFALLIVACDKYEDNFEAPISVIEMDEANASVDSEARNIILDIIFGGVADSAPVYKGGNNSASKGLDYIAAYILVKDGESFIVLVDEANDDLCFGEQAVSTAYVNNSDGNGNATIEDANEQVTKDLGPGYSNLFSSPLNEITQLDFNGASLIVETAQFDAENSATFNN